MTRPSTLVVGWREWVTLPDLGGVVLKAKVDTGARTSSLHATDIEVGDEHVVFTLHPHQRSPDDAVRVSARLVAHRVIRPSSGHADERPVVRTTVVLHGRRWTIDLTLADRSVMGFRMLLGRVALHRRFLVDPGASYLSGHPDQT